MRSYATQPNAADLIPNQSRKNRYLPGTHTMYTTILREEPESDFPQLVDGVGA